MNTKKNWFAVTVAVISEASEAIEFAFNQLGADGTEINNLGKKQSEIVSVVGYFEENPAIEVVKNQLNEALRIYAFETSAIQKIDCQKIGNTDWLAEWKKHWRATETENFIVAPTWEIIEETEKFIIRIEPSMAFGTGTHETTRLCLKAVEENFRSEMSFFDVGTGTGILAIAAAKIKVQSSKFKVQSREKAKTIFGCDTDEDSIKIAAENAEMNEVGDSVEFYVGSISEETPEYDFVCANLTIDVITPILRLLIEKSKRFLILSGILKEQEKSIVEELKELAVENYKIETLGEWISVLVFHESN